MTLEPANLFIVADGMGGQQAGEKASLMAVELIPKAIARRLTPEEKESRQIQEAIREAVAEVNSGDPGQLGAGSPNTRTWARPSSWPSSARIASSSRASAIPGRTGSATASSSS